VTAIVAFRYALVNSAISELMKELVCHEFMPLYCDMR
jgi:hypothetical protein